MVVETDTEAFSFSWTLFVLFVLKGMPRAVAKALVSREGPECLDRRGPRVFLFKSGSVAATALVAGATSFPPSFCSSVEPTGWAAESGAVGREEEVDEVRVASEGGTDRGAGERGVRCCCCGWSIGVGVGVRVRV